MDKLLSYTNKENVLLLIGIQLRVFKLIFVKNHECVIMKKDIDEYSRKLTSSFRELTAKPKLKHIDCKNFCDTSPGIYIIYNENDSVIYIGSASNLKKRVCNNLKPNTQKHTFKTKMLGILDLSQYSELLFDKSTFQLMNVDSVAEANALEYFAIWIFNPSHNGKLSQIRD